MAFKIVWRQNLMEEHALEQNNPHQGSRKGEREEKGREREREDIP